jgi:hypothetical protein
MKRLLITAPLDELGNTITTGTTVVAVAPMPYMTYKTMATLVKNDRQMMGMENEG